MSLVSNNLTNIGRRHCKLFTNCHVSYDTLYLIKQNFSGYCCKSDIVVFAWMSPNITVHLNPILKYDLYSF